MLLKHALRTVCAVALTSAIAFSTTAAEPMRGTSTDDWQGFGIITSGKGYAPSPMGQVHYRDIGPRDTKYPIVLLHQTPMSMIQWAAVQNALAEIGIRAITIDTPGYGLSDRPKSQPSIADYANNLIPVLDHLKLGKVIIAGHHTGAHIAASFAAHHGDRVAAIIMHGPAPMNAEEADGYLSRKPAPRTPLADGSHLARGFAVPDPTDTQDILDAKTWLAVTTYIQGPDIGHWAAFRYDMSKDLPLIKAPGMILSDVNDAVHAMDLRGAKARPDWKYVEFSNGNLLQFMAEPKRWAGIAAEFMKTIK